MCNSERSKHHQHWCAPLEGPVHIRIQCVTSNSRCVTQAPQLASRTPPLTPPTNFNCNEHPFERPDSALQSQRRAPESSLLTPHQKIRGMSARHVPHLSRQAEYPNSPCPGCRKPCKPCARASFPKVERVDAAVLWKFPRLAHHWPSASSECLHMSPCPPPCDARHPNVAGSSHPASPSESSRSSARTSPEPPPELSSESASPEISNSWASYQPLWPPQGMHRAPDKG